MRDRLIELLKKEIYPKEGVDGAEVVADYLLDNGVIVPRAEGEWLVSAWDGERFVEIPYIKHEHIDPYCSLCKEHALLNGAEFGVASNYCPNCGAKMKGGD